MFTSFSHLNLLFKKHTAVRNWGDNGETELKQISGKYATYVYSDIVKVKKQNKKKPKEA